MCVYPLKSFWNKSNLKYLHLFGKISLQELLMTFYLVRTKLQGGLSFPNIFNKVKTQNIMWVKRLLNEESPWKIIPKFDLSKIGGINNILISF